MSLFDNIGKKIGETAQATKKKTNEMLELTKLNKSISAEEDKIEKVYLELGKKLYALYAEGQDVGEHFEVECEEISVYQDNIKELKDKIMELKNIRLCPGCGAEIEEDAAFCPRCGAKMEPLPQKTVETQENIQELDYKVCPICGSKLTLEAAFCPSCGTKQEVDNEKEEQVHEEQKVCPQCGADIKEGQSFCLNCGAKLD